LRSIAASGIAPGGASGVVPASTRPGATTTATGAAGAVVEPAGEPIGGDTFTHLRRAEQMPGFARGEWYIENFGLKVGKLTPLLATDIYQKWVEYQVMESLATRDPYTLEFVPRLARSWSISDDGLTMTFSLRRDVTFSDGSPLTSEDVKFTFDFIRNPDVNAARERSYLTMLKDVQTPDPFTVVFTFTEPYFRNFETVASASVMSKAFYGQYAVQQFNDSVGLLFGSGPYRLETPDGWSPGTPVVLYRNDRYWGPAGTFERIYFQEIREESAQMVMYGNREHDSIFCTPEMYDRLREDARVMAFSKAMKYDSPYRGYSYIGWNQQRRVEGEPRPTAFADARVRRAMTMLLDRERLAREIFRGYARAASGPFTPGGPQADPDVKPLPFDPDAARALLAEAGFADRDGDGIIEGPDGSPLRFTLLYPSGSELYEKLVLFFRDAYARAGIVMELDSQDWPVLVDRLNKSDFDAVTLGWSSTPESDPYQIFHSSQIGDEGDNRTFYRNAELDTLIDRARRTLDREQRMQMWQQVHRILHEDQPYTFLINRPYLRLMHERIQNVEPSGVGLNFEYLNGGVMPWYVPADRQVRTK
jgi:peptide/nickel transport system substrate-binding protein